jgi:transposase InsO family protein
MIKTNPRQREAMYRLQQTGMTYSAIGQQFGLSPECVRYWCRRQRDGQGAETVYPHRRILEGFDPLVRLGLLRFRLSHPKWGPKSLRFHLLRSPSLQGLAIPSRAQIGRYLHQWERFRRSPKLKFETAQPRTVTRVHQRWQLDFKVQIPLGGQRVQLFTLVDEFSGACLGAWLFPNPSIRVRLADVVTFLRYAFNRWGLLPEELQTDGEVVLVGRPGEHYFPTKFTLWLVGLGITQQVIPSRKPTENAEVERCHRTLHEYALVGREKLDCEAVNRLLEQATQELAHEMPSGAKNCQDRPPVVAYPGLLDPQHPYHSEQEPQLFSLQRVDAFLAKKAWLRRVEKAGLISIGEQRTYSVGRKYAGQHVLVHFDPQDRHFVFYRVDTRTLEPIEEIQRRPTRGLEEADLILLSGPPLAPIPLQLQLPLVWSEGVDVKEQMGV